MSSVSFNLPQPGTWTVQGEFAGQIVTQQVEITEKGATVPVTLAFDAATITVTSPVGTSLLLTDGTNQLTAVSTGTNTFTIYNMGQWTVSGTLEGYTLNTETVTVTDGNNYPVQLSIQIAALTVTAPVGTVVTVSGGGASQQETATTGTVVFNLTQLDTYTVSGTLGELISETETVQVTAFQPYSVTLTINSATIVVYTIPGTLVTVQNGGTTLTGTAEGDTGQVSFAVQIFGVWNVSGALEGYTFTPTTVDVQAYQDYGVNLDPLVATITVTAPAGTEVVAEDSTGQQVQGYADQGTAVLEIYSFGTWTVSGSQNGLVTNAVPVDVADWTNYPVTLTIWAATITVTTPTGTLVTAQNGLNQIQATAANDQVIFAVQETGNWLVSAQFDTQSDSETVNVQAEEDYPIRLWVPTIVPTVVTGSVVTCTQGDTVLTKTSQSGKVKFYVPALGEWTVHATLNQQSSNTVTVDVQEDRDYPMLLDYEFATITVSTVAGTEVTAQNGAIIITQTADSNGEAVFEVATFGTWTVSADFDGELVTAQVEVSDTINYDVEIMPTSQGEIYGAYWAGTSNPVWTRTDAAAGFSAPNPAVNNGTGSSPFDNIMPWSGMTRVTDPVAGEMVQIPKYWYKWTRDGVSMKLQIANYAADGFYVSPAHADRGDSQGERDIVYVGRYHCNSSYVSQTGVQPLGSITRATARAGISALGAEYWQYDFAMYWTIAMLYLVEFANWNSQAMIGYGCSPSGSRFNMGLTDTMKYHTGTSAATRETYGCCQYRNIESLWDNVYDWCDGIYFSGANVFCIKNPASFSDTSGGTNVGTRATSSGWISGWTNPTASGFEYALYPNAVAGSETTFVCDYCYYRAGGVVLRVGGDYLQNQVRGAFCLYGSNAASYQGASIGCRLQKLP